MKKYTFNTDYFKKIDTEDKAYWLGFIAADGYLNKKGNTVGICLDIKDIEHLEKFKKDISFTGNIFTRFSRYSSEHRATQKAILEIYSKELSRDISAFGLDYNKSHSLADIKNIPNDLIPHFIRGYFDGDGCLFFSKGITTLHKGSPGITLVGTEKFLEFISKYLPDVPKNLRKDSRTKGTFILYMKSMKRYRRFTDFIYKNATVYLDRKFLKHQDITRKIT